MWLSLSVCYQVGHRAAYAAKNHENKMLSHFDYRGLVQQSKETQIISSCFSLKEWKLFDSIKRIMSGFAIYQKLYLFF